MRAFCHCTVCQSFNQAPFADITLFRGRDVDMPADGLVNYKAYLPPPIVPRGKCVQCDRPAVEYLRFLPRVVIVPTANIQDRSLVPEPSLHVFYDTRVADIDDGLAKYEGYLRSQSAFIALLYKRLLRSERKKSRSTDGTTSSS